MTKKLIMGLVFCTLLPLTSMAQRLLQPMGRGVVVTYRKSTEWSVTASGGNGYLVSLCLQRIREFLLQRRELFGITRRKRLEPCGLYYPRKS